MTPLSTLQAGRAIAALMVVLFHAHVYFIPDALYPGVSVFTPLNFGYAGVEFFFVLSGFLMALIHGKDLGIPARLGNFARKRFVRIYPFYWVFLLGLLLLYRVMGTGPERASDLNSIVHSFFLIPNGEDFILTAAWTLSHEVLFYLVFALLIFNRTIGLAVMAVWILGIVAQMVLHQPFPMDFLFSAHNLLFFMGMMAASVFRVIPRPAATMAAVLGIGGFVGIGLVDSAGMWPFDEAWRTIAFGLAATASLTGLTNLELNKLVSAPGWLVFVGDASYSIYLVHGPALSILTVIALKLGLNQQMPAWLMLIAISTAATIAGMLVHVLVEKPLLHAMGRRHVKASALAA